MALQLSLQQAAAPTWPPSSPSTAWREGPGHEKQFSLGGLTNSAAV